jgi:hypothetical protein
MQKINRRFHAVVDYLTGTFLLAAPWALQFNVSTAGTTVCVFAGVVLLIVSMMTDYEGGLAYHVPMAMHLNLEILLGIFLALSPWLLEFSRQVYMPHLIIGLLLVTAGFFTVRTSLSDRQHK